MFRQIRPYRFTIIANGSCRFIPLFGVQTAWGARPTIHTTPGMPLPNATHFGKSTMGVVGVLWGFVGVKVRCAQQIRPRSRAPPGVGSKLPIHNVQEHCLLFSLRNDLRKGQRQVDRVPAPIDQPKCDYPLVSWGWCQYTPGQIREFLIGCKMPGAL